MKTIRKLLLLCLFGMISMGIYATEWQTWTGKGCIVDTYDSPAPSDDSNGNHWYSEEYDDSQWADISGPIESFKEGGAYYVRRIVELPDDYTNRSYCLRVNSDDESAYYINGHFVGTSSSCEEHRLYIDNSFVKSGSNVIAAVVYDSGNIEQYLYMNFDIYYGKVLSGFEYVLEDGIVSVSDIEGYDYADDAKFLSEIELYGVKYDVTRIDKMQHIKKLFIPASISSLTDPAPWASLGLQITSIEVDESNNYFTLFDGCLYNKEVTELLWGINKSHVVVPEGVKKIGSWTFQDRDKLETIQLPSTLEGEIHGTFAGCASLKSINIPPKIQWLYYQCFGGCTSLESVYVNTSFPIEIAEYTFDGINYENCTLHVPVGAKDLYSDYKYWSNFGTIVEDESLVATDISNIQNGYRYEIEDGEAAVSDLNINYNSNHFIQENVTIKGITYPVTKLNSIIHHTGNFNIPYFIKSIREGASWDCLSPDLSITVDEMNKYYTSIDGNLYNKEVTKLVRGANNQNVVIPEGVKSIAIHAFDSHAELKTIELPSTLEGSLYRTFERCIKLESINIPNNIKFIDDTCFEGCENLKNVILPINLERIGYNIFSNCRNLDAIVIPSKVHDILDLAFCGCTNLKEITCLIPTPLLIESNVFDGVDKENAVLYVPIGSKQLYESAPVWKEFANIVELNNALSLETVDALHGSQVTVPVNMVNESEISAVQFDLYLSNGITLAKDEYGYDMVEVASRSTSKKHNTIETAVQPDGAIRIMCASSKNYAFSGNEGTILNLTFNVADDMKRGASNIVIKNIILSTAESEGYEQKLCVGALNVYDNEQGDVTDDYKINVADYTAMKDIIDGTITDGIKVQLADFNNNGSADAEDQSSLAEKILTMPTEQFEEPVDNPYYDNMLVVDEAMGLIGNQMILPIKLNNYHNISAIQFDLELPEGISIATDNSENAILSLSIRTTADAHDTFKAVTMADGSARILCASTKNAVFNGNDGEILSITLNVDKEMEEGNYFFKIKNVVMATPLSEVFEQQFFKSVVKVKAYEMGDLNKDTKINVVDYTALVSMIMGTDGGAFPLELADFSGNGKVDVTDLTAIVNKIMNGASSPAKSVKRTALKSATAPEENRLSLIPFAIAPGEEKEVSLQMFNTAEISAYQTDIVLPEGIEIVKDEDDFYLVEVATRTTYKKHNTMEAEEQEDGSIRLMCASSKNAVFDGNEGEVAVITVKASSTLEPGVYNITLKNTILSTADSYGYEPEPSIHSAIVGSPEIASATLHGDYTADAISELNTALASNTVLSAIDFTEATSVDASTKIETGNQNLLVYVSEGTDVANSQNVVEGDECESLVLTDGYNFAAPKAFTAVSASYSRTAPSTYGTTVLPFVPSTSGAEFYELTGVAPTCFEFQKVVSPVAGTPYLYRATSDNFTATNAEIAATEAGKVTASGWTMQGTYTKEVFDASDNVYAVSDDKVYCNIGTLTMNPFRAYFTGNTSSAPMNISIDGTTVIGSIENGEMAIDGAAFNLAGQKVSKSYKGIVITNGRKEIRK